MEASPEYSCGSKSGVLKGKNVQRRELSSGLWVSPVLFEVSSVRKCSKVPQKCRLCDKLQVRSGTTEQKVFEVKGCATDRGGLCSLVVLGKCSKMGAFPALWWLFGTEVAGKCLKAPEKCRI